MSKKTAGERNWHAAAFAILASVISFSCGSLPTSRTAPGQTPVANGQLQVTPASLSFGNVALGSSKNMKGTLTAGASDVTVSSAAWNGQGYALSGISFPVTVPANQNLSFTVTFTPQQAGNATGSISFISDALNSPSNQTLSGAGKSGGAARHSVSLSWDASTSLVAGYNIYRGTHSGGPYTRMNAGLQPAAAYVDQTVQSGTTYFYVATSVSGNSESAYSNEAVAVIPSP